MKTFYNVGWIWRLFVHRNAGHPKVKQQQRFKEAVLVLDILFADVLL
jgi:hypothetical protein